MFHMDKKREMHKVEMIAEVSLMQLWWVERLALSNFVHNQRTAINIAM